MAGLGVGGGEEDLDHFSQLLQRERASPEREDVGVVVLPRVSSLGLVSASGGANPGNLVRHHRGANPGAVEDDALAGMAERHHERDLVGEVGVVDGIGGVSAAIDGARSDLAQVGNELPLHLEPAVVASYRYPGGLGRSRRARSRFDDADLSFRDPLPRDVGEDGAGGDVEKTPFGKGAHVFSGKDPPASGILPRCLWHGEQSTLAEPFDATFGADEPE